MRQYMSDAHKNIRLVIGMVTCMLCARPSATARANAAMRRPASSRNGVSRIASPPPIISTDPKKSPSEKLEKQFEKNGLYDAIDIGLIWLEKLNRKK